MKHTNIQILASRFPFNLYVIEKTVKLCGGDLNASEWILELLVAFGGSFHIPITKDIQDFLVAIAKYSTRDNPRGNTW